jgi:sec-independent protein translocase protein TatB
MFPEGRILDFALVGVIALIVVGPKDLPILMRKVGQWVARMRAMAAEFRASFDELARQSELEELRREVEAMRADRLVATAVGGDAAGQMMEEIRTGMSAPLPGVVSADGAEPAPSDQAAHESPGEEVKAPS